MSLSYHTYALVKHKTNTSWMTIGDTSYNKENPRLAIRDPSKPFSAAYGFISSKSKKRLVTPSQLRPAFKPVTLINGEQHWRFLNSLEFKSSSLRITCACCHHTRAFGFDSLDSFKKHFKRHPRPSEHAAGPPSQPSSPRPPPGVAPSRPHHHRATRAMTRARQSNEASTSPQASTLGAPARPAPLQTPPPELPAQPPSQIPSSPRRACPPPPKPSSALPISSPAASSPGQCAQITAIDLQSPPPEPMHTALLPAKQPVLSLPSAQPRHPLRSISSQQVLPFLAVQRARVPSLAEKVLADKRTAAQEQRAEEAQRRADMKLQQQRELQEKQARAQQKRQLSGAYETSSSKRLKTAS